jgi:pyrroloquinoline quinone biosynthesis protein D
VLRLCDGRRSLAQIAEELAAEYDAPAGQIESDIEEMLRDLADRGLVTA